MFAVLKSIRESVDPSAPIKYEWDDKNEEDHYVREDARLYKRLSPMSKRAIMALAAGCAEWIGWRLEGTSLDAQYLQYLEASWAGLIDFDYIEPHKDYDLGEVMGPVRGPLNASLHTLRHIVRFTYEGEWGRTETVYLYYLARYVLPDRKAFTAWFDTVVERLCTHYPKPQSNEELGEPVPRQVIDTSTEFKPEQAREQIAEFLKGLAPSHNPFLKVSAATGS